MYTLQYSAGHQQSAATRTSLLIAPQVVRWYAREQGLKFNALQPVNEPFEGFWKRGNRQEGCSFGAPDMDRLLPLVAKSLRRKRLQTPLVGVDSGAGLTPGALRKMNKVSISLLSQIHVHGYTYKQGRTDAVVQASYTAMRQAGERYRREVWMTEWGPKRCDGTDDLTLALCMGKAIIASVNLLRATAWFYWQVIDSEEIWTLIDIPWDYNVPFKYRINKRFWALKHFTDSVPGGSQRIALPASASPGCNNAVAAFYVSSRLELTVIVVNDRASDQTLTVSIQGFRRRYSRRGFGTLNCQTSSKYNFKCFPGTVLSNLGAVQISTRARSISRLTISNIAKQ